MAKAMGVERLVFELVERREQDAVRSAPGAGFKQVALLKGRVRDTYGSLQDLVLLEKILE